MIWTVMFSGGSVGYVNGMLLYLGIIDSRFSSCLIRNG